MDALRIFPELQGTPGKNAKRDLLATLDPIQKGLFVAALDPAKVYFVNVNPDDLPPPAQSSSSEATLLKEFYVLADALGSRTIVGDQARDAIRYFMGKCTADEQQWFSRILNKDLRIGVDTQFHDLYPEAYAVFECQLCKTYEDQNVEGWYYEDKWNGLRALAVPNDLGVHGFYSRNGKAVPGMEAVSAELAEARMPDDRSYVFDGEGFGGDWDDQVGQSVSKIRGNKSHADITFNLFDMIPMDQWVRIPEKGFKTEVLAIRRQRLEQFFDMNPQLKQLRLVQQGTIDTNAGKSPVAVRDEAISRRLEGVIIKNPQGHYRPGKHKGLWYKFKMRNPEDVEVVGAVEGTKKYEGKLGAIVVRYKGVDSEVGTGFTDEQRRDFWEMHQRGELAGHVAEIEWGEITKDGKLFHTAFKRLRFDK